MSIFFALIILIIIGIAWYIARDKQKTIENLSLLLQAYKQRESEISALDKKSREKLQEANKSAKSVLERAHNIEHLANNYKYQVEEELSTRLAALSEREEKIRNFESNLSAIPYAAAIISDFDTRGIELLASSLDWGDCKERRKKVASIREIHKETKLQILNAMQAKYQLEYAIRMFPALEDFLETDFNELPTMDLSHLEQTSHDCVRDYISSEEYQKLGPSERNQLALDRYWKSHHRSNWQVGRDYEMYVGYRYSKKGYKVHYYGALHGLDDLGRDLIAKKDSDVLIIQCKYWSSKKTIHEKHINQLYGTMICYCFENNISTENVHGILVTNISVSETARNFAKYLGIELVEHFQISQYPCIKCNINNDKFGRQTKIYHLPFDQQYDSCVINEPGEFYALTVAEAENAGFRRAHRWCGA